MELNRQTKDCPYNKLSKKSFFPQLENTNGSLLLERNSDFIINSNDKIISFGSCFASKIKIICNKLASKLGINTQNSLLSESSHPFSTTLGQQDFRITTSYKEENAFSAFFAVAHESGHSLYEQGLSSEYFGTTIGQAASYGVHESQSLFWENRIAGSKPFMKSWFPYFKKYFPNNFKNFDENTFYSNAIQVKPGGLIRVESDEVTYCLHIIIRYEIERKLINSEMEVEEVENVWNQMYEKRLGITPPDSKRGFLQDVHWSCGAFGYFPSYTLGHLMSAQLTKALEEDLKSNIDDLISNQKTPEILEWMRTNIHSLGAEYKPLDLVKKITNGIKCNALESIL